MKAVILDRVTLGDDINLDKLADLTELKIYEKTSSEQLEERIKDVEIIITNKVIIGKKEMDIAKKLKLICVAATGYNNIDIEEANTKNILVANVKKYSTESVAQVTFGYILSIQNSLLEYTSDVKSGKWNKSSIFTMLDYPIYELKNKKIGIIGYGAIGRRVGEIAKAFGMEVLIAKRPGVDYIDDFRNDFEEVLSKSDIISIHVPLNLSTKDLIRKNHFNLMKKSAILINTSRGGIVNEEDLYEALKNKKIKAAALDVLCVEPPRNGSKLFELDNIFITPHIAWASKESRQRLIDGIISNIINYKDGKGEEIKVE